MQSIVAPRAGIFVAGAKPKRRCTGPYCKFRRQSQRRKDQARRREGLHHGLLDQLLGVMPRLGLDPGGWDVAADLWAKGQVHKPAVNFAEQDLLIAATALWHGLALATAETKNAMAAWLPNLAPRLQLRVVRPES
ncbi:MAG: hypothetical protein R6X02_07105 [Enhygromyxa sp.]